MRRFSEPTIKTVSAETKAKPKVIRTGFVDYNAGKERLEELLDYAVEQHPNIRFFSKSPSQQFLLFNSKKYNQTVLNVNKVDAKVTPQEKHCIDKIRKLSQ